MKRSRRFGGLLVSLIATLLPSLIMAQSSTPVPQINQPLLPSSVAPGSPAFVLKVNGTGFVSGSLVRFNGGALATTFVSSSQLSATVPAPDVATSQTGEITVTNPGVSSPSNVVYLPVVAPFTNVTMLRQDYLLGNSPAAVGVGDFNGDGIPDLAVSTAGISGASYISVLLGYGDGTFQQQPLTYPTGAFPLGIVVADFNGDGKLDVATANSNDGTVSVLLGNGDGSFQAQKKYTVGSFFTEGIAAGDFNHDGKLDLVACNYSDNSLGILLGNGDGTFQPSVSIPVGVAPWHVVTADFNRDGNLDLAFVSPSAGTLSIMLGNGDGTFQSPAEYTITSFPLDLVSADFNGDGVLDIAVVGDDTSGTLSVLLGRGDGTFETPSTSATLDQAQAVVAGDFNGDGKLDLAVQTFNCPVACSESDLAVMLGNGDGTFQSPLSFSATNLGSWVATGDFNNDGKLDFAIGVYYNESDISVLLQTPAISVTPGVVNFGNQNVGTTGVQNATLTNNTTNTITITAITPSAGFGETNTCGTLPAKLGPGASCTITASFSPTSIGAFAGTVVISDNGGTGTQTIHLSGEGVEPIATLSKTHLLFPATAVGQKSAPQVVRLINSGNAALAISSITLTGDSGNFAETNTCPPTLFPNANCRITVTFTPQAKGTLRGGIQINDDATPPKQTIALFGTGE